MEKRDKRGKIDKSYLPCFKSKPTFAAQSMAQIANENNQRKAQTIFCENLIQKHEQ